MSATDDIEDTYPLTPMQRAMLTQSIAATGSGVYVMQTTCELREALDVPLLEQAWRTVIARHTVLRTAFRIVNAVEPIQIVHRQVALPWTHEDWSAHAPDEQARRFDARVEAERRREFDIGSAPLMRLVLLRLAENHFRLLWTYHHALLDGRSRRIVLREVLDAYDAYKAGREPELPPPIPFRAFVDALAQRDGDAAARHWQKALARCPAPTALEACLPPPAGSAPSARYAAHEIRLPARATEALAALARDRGLTLNTLVTGAWAQLLSRYAGTDDVTFGVTLTLRGAASSALHEAVGLLINVVPMRVTLPPRMPLGRWLDGLRAQWLALREHGWAPVSKIRQWGGLPHDSGLISTLIAFEHASLDAALAEERAAWTTRRFGIRGAATQPVTLVAFGARELSLKIVYDRSLFEHASIVAMLAHLATLLEGAAAGLEHPLADQPLLTDAERHRQLVAWNDTARAFAREDCAHRLFERSAARTPDAVAVEGERGTLTYRELNGRSNRLARRLRRLGVGAGARVGLCMERSPEVVVAMLGIMKAGGAYLPIDADNPPARIAAIVRDAGLEVLVTTQVSAPHVAGLAETIIALDAGPGGRAGEDDGNVAENAGPDDIAYAVYTSGSTGEPKGIVVSHRALTNHTLALCERYAIGPADRRLQFVSIGSDVLIAEVFPILAAGGTLVLRPAGGLLSIADFLRILTERRITIAGLPSAYWHEWVAAMQAQALPFPPSLRLVVSGMDRVRPDLFAVWMRNVDRRIRWFNAYGPSEATCTAASYEADLRAREAPAVIPIGRPLPNVRIYLLDALRRPVPVGVAGELYIGGHGVARGYLDRPELTAAAFVPDPFSADPRSRLYRTGDLGRYRSDGNIEFLGRVDDQVKIRGFRVEPAEVEAALRALPGVAEACVVARGAPDSQRRLLAYVVPTAQMPPEPSALRAQLGQSLPQYMVPAGIAMVAAIPLTLSGKVDVAALVDSAGAPDSPRRTPAPPASALEAALAQLWEALLGAIPGVDDNFFDLGGDSLRGVQLLNAVHAEFGVEIPLAALFGDAATVAGMASRIALAREGAPRGPRMPTIRRCAADAVVPLSGQQAGAWFLHRLDPSGIAYNEARLWGIDGELDARALQAALAAVAAHQPMLRTRFVTVDGKPRQVVDAEARVELEHVDLSGAAAPAQQALDAAVSARVRRRFDLARATPTHWTLFDLGAGRRALLRVAHHILGDALSTRILFRELSDAYAALRAGRSPAARPLAVDYADYAMWRMRAEAAPEFGRRIGFWKDRLRNLPVLGLPTDFRRPPAQSFRGDVVALTLARDTAAALRALARAHGTTPFCAYLAAFTALLSRLAGSTDIPLGTPVGGRPLPELADVIGFFANTVVVRADLSGAPTAHTLLERTHDAVREVLAHQDVPFERIVEAAGMPRDPSRNPLFQVAFAMWERDGDDPKFAGATLRRLDMGLARAKFDLTVSVIESAERIDVHWEYCTDLFRRSTVERMSRQYARLVEAMVADPRAAVASLPLMDETTAAAVLRAGIGRHSAYPETMTIPERFAVQARATPRARAIGALDYAGLDASANRLARALCACGVGAGAIVAVARRASADVAVAWLAVLKAGGAYLPIDPDLPPQRIAYLLADARVAHAIADDALAGVLAQPGVDVIRPDADAARIAAHAADALAPAATPDDPAYAIYTSGSTGAPKGVVVPHRAVLRLVCNTDCAQLGADDVVAQLANPAFDASTFEFWGALLNGARLVPIARTTAIAPRALAAALASEGVTALFLTTALFNAVARDTPDAFRACRCVLFGGEACEPRRVADVLRAGPPRELLHVYGPTETTTFATWHAVRDVAPNAVTVPIGKPLANTEVFVLRPDGALAAPGEPGEVWIGGPGVALGYLDAGEREAARFVERPVGPLPARRLYRTGDHARLDDAHALVFLGRDDLQVKIRGHRIEPAEVEAAIGRLAGVRAAAVAVRGETTDTRQLVAYVVAADASAPPPADLRHALRGILPEFMLPSSIVWLKSLPLNASGKVDRGALPAAAPAMVRSAGAQHVAPRDMLEQVLAGIWQRVLEVDTIGVFDHFFDIGGHSLLAARLFDEIERETGASAPLAALFVDDTIAGLARALRESPAAITAPILPLNADGACAPLVFLHGDLTGGGFYCRALATALGADQPLLVVQPHGVDNALIPDTIEAMAAQRIRALRTLRPHGPYVLAGYCNGALVAFEMGRQLVRAGEDVPRIVVIEASAPGGTAGFASGGGRYVTLDRDGGVRTLAARDRATEAQLRYSQAIDRYAGGRYDGRLVLVRSEAVAGGRGDAGWARFASSIESHTLPGDHVTLVTRHVAALAGVLRDVLRQLPMRAT